ncbi:hypothetical protein [Anaerotignum sp.]
MKSYEVLGKEYPVIGIVETNTQLIPLVDIPMMSDERWNELCMKQTMENYKKLSGMGEAPDYETALAWENEFFKFEWEKDEKKSSPDPARYKGNNNLFLNYSVEVHKCQ